MNVYQRFRIGTLLGLTVFASAFALSGTSDASGTTYYVSPSGSDSQAGTIGAPFLTIGKAAATAQAGDTVSIRGGTYRETVKPSHSGTAGNPIRYEAYSGETVTVSGTNSIGGWTLHSGNIYKTTVQLPLDSGDQLFVDGVMAQEARWPNYGAGDLLHPTLATADAGTTPTSLYDAAMPDLDWTGAKLWVWSSSKWTAWTTTVTGYAGRTVSFASSSPDIYNDAAAGGNYFLSGTLAALDSENEWYYDRSTSTLYLWAPGGGNPGSRVEYKARNVAFDLTGSAYTELNGIGLFAATIDTGNYGGDAYRVRLTGTGSAVSQVVYGLSPNTKYHFTGSVKAATDGESVTAGVRNFDGTGRSDTVYQSYYRTFDLIFTTGPSATSAEIYLEKTGGGGDAFGDGFAIKQNGINLVNNPGFEAGSLSSWMSAGTAAAVANPYADHVVIDGLDAVYVAHDARSDTGYGSQRYSGIILNGTNNVLKNSTVAYSSGNGVNLGGLGKQLVNSIIHDVDYSGTYAAAIQMNGAEHLVSHNTAYGSGRSIVNGFGRNSRIQYNDFGHSGYLSADLGLMYTYGSDGEGTEIHHNYIHDNHAENHAQGIYLDNGSSNYLVYKNKVENIPERGININLPSEFNLIASNDSIVGGSGFAWAYGTDHWGFFLLNNKGALVRMNTESIRAANNENGGIDAGVVVPGVTDGYAGAAPDIGSVEYGQTAWSYGTDLDNPPNPSFQTADTPYRNRLDNSGFERGKLDHWTLTGGMNVALIDALPGLPSPDSTTRNGQYAASLASGTNGLERTITGLEPNTAYSFSVWVKVESGETVRIGVSNTGTPDQWSDVGGTGNEFVRRIITFNTGASGTGATLSITRTSSGGGYVCRRYGPDSVSRSDRRQRGRQRRLRSGLVRRLVRHRRHAGDDEHGFA
ncbi:carbohydrate binding domain-containing protein [Paenibacillus cymbidii]|uniref:carbohydrate binding domain-containing protein n=1 Tax=Paenibacillus cymbidii TaxID=1639034 RepID=UPI001F4270CA|nr:carbohydrate binding domain-containing protein [Paenibacillus cymbidii]